MQFFVNLWNWFNGNKTKIGALLLSIAALLPDGIMVVGYDLKAELIVIGSTFAGVGLVHMGVKATANVKAINAAPKQ